MQNPFSRVQADSLQNLIDKALSAASKYVEKERFEDDAIENARQKEGIRVKVVGSNLHDWLMAYAASFPDPKYVPKIYSQLSDALVGNDDLVKAKIALNKVAVEAKKLQMHYLRVLGNARHTYQFRNIRKEFYGRCVALLKKNRRHITLLYQASRTLTRLPNFEIAPTVIISGLPNVGKTSLLKVLTGSEPEIAPYPFTTKGLMLGFAEIKGKKIQFIDTPGLLDRPMKRRNKIEMQAVAALENLANAVIFIYDPTETCGYTLEQQKNLFNDVRKQINVPLVVVSNKSDLVGAREVESDLKISCTNNDGLDALKTFISEKLKL